MKQAGCAFGVFYGRLKARLGPSHATVATAHALARVVYRMLTLAPHVLCAAKHAGEYQVEYEPLSLNEYQKHYEEQQIKYMKKKAAKFGFQLVPTQTVSEKRWVGTLLNFRTPAFRNAA